MPYTSLVDLDRTHITQIFTVPLLLELHTPPRPSCNYGLRRQTVASPVTTSFIWDNQDVLLATTLTDYPSLCMIITVEGGPVPGERANSTLHKAIVARERECSSWAVAVY